MRAIALIESPGHVCARYRIAAFEPALNEAGCSLTIAAIPRGALARIRLFSTLNTFDTVLLQRRLLPAYQLKYLRYNSRRLIFDFDDAVFCRDSYDPRGIPCAQRARRFRNTMGATDEVVAGNAFLKDQAIACGAKAGAVQIIPTCVDPGKSPLAKQSKEGLAKESLDLVWIGSSSTLQGLETCRARFEQLADRFPTLRVRVISDRFPDFTRPPIVAIPWTEATESADLAASDIGISSVPDDLWSRGKCGLKILQYYAAGLPVIANSVGVHAEMVQPGITGVLADTNEQWIDAVQLLSDPRVRQQMGSAARQYVEQHYSVAAHRNSFVEVVTRRHR